MDYLVKIRSVQTPQNGQFSIGANTLDFIEFLEQRYAPIPTKTKKQNDTEAFLSAIAGGLSEDFPDDISNENLGVDALREALD
jgi:hypothetical protein